MPWIEAALPEQLSGRVAIAVADGRVALARPREPVVVASVTDKLAAALSGGELVCHDFKSLPHELPQAGLLPWADTLLAAYLIEPGRASYLLPDLETEYGFDLRVEPAVGDPVGDGVAGESGGLVGGGAVEEHVDEETATLVRAAAAALRLAEPMTARVVELGMGELYRDVEIPLTAVLAAMEDAGVRIDTYRMGEITARLTDQVEELEARAHELAGEPFLLGSTQQVARILFEKLGLEPGRKGKTGYSTDTRVLRGLRDDHPIVGVIEEWREYSKLLNTYLGPLPSQISPAGRASAHDVQPDRGCHREALDVEPESPVDSDPHRARALDPQRLRGGARLEAPVGRLFAGRATHPRPRVGRAEAARGVPAG